MSDNRLGRWRARTLRRATRMDVAAVVTISLLAAATVISGRSASMALTPRSALQVGRLVNELELPVRLPDVPLSDEFGEQTALLARIHEKLVRRRLMWIVVIIALGGAALNYWAARSIDKAMGAGASWAIATRQAASNLDDLASTVLGWAGFVVVILAAQVSPESRRNGTTQFVLSTGVRRETVAAAQFVALAVLLAGATLVTHVAFVIAGLKTGSVTILDATFGWPLFFVSLAAVAAAVLAVSLTASAIESCLLFLGVPLLTRVLPGLMRGLPSGLPMWIVRAIENVALLFPDPSAIVAWPHATFAPHATVPSAFGMSVVHFFSAATFWVVLGVDRQRRHDFGSRTAVI